LKQLPSLRQASPPNRGRDGKGVSSARRRACRRACSAAGRRDDSLTPSCTCSRLILEPWDTRPLASPLVPGKGPPPTGVLNV
jgi:hypothetical protein